ncbi:hypothetical protein ACFSR6_21160 [Pedobacter vanadiisoli]|uniref:Nuclear transport factor 2 family protein n=1 Tax=Pedobacter vanadiisoli TaxID=1761975 RepID=A0ABW5MNV1_9SPHI
MRCLSILILVVLTVGCNRKENKTIQVAKVQQVTQQDSIEAIGLKALTALQAKNYEAFAALFHPTEGVRFSPYGFIDPTHKQVLAKDFLEAIKRNWILTWGHVDGSGEAIKIRVKAYIDQFIYNADYLHAPQKSYDAVIGKGNSIDNLKDAYPQLHFTEYHFKGFDEKYRGLDWTSLRFVFKKYNDNYYLVAVIHDQWTV